MLSNSRWPAAEVRPLGGPRCAVARRPVVWGRASRAEPRQVRMIRTPVPYDTVGNAEEENGCLSDLPPSPAEVGGGDFQLSAATAVLVYC